MSHRYADFDLVVDGRVLEFRTTLRAAYTLDQRYKGLENLINEIAADKISAVWDILKQTAKNLQTRDRIEELKAKPLAVWMKDGLFDLLMNVACALAGIDRTAVGTSSTKAGKRLTYEEHFDDLFAKATGWLNYTPEQAWQSTPLELEAALAARIEFFNLTSGLPADDDSQSPVDAPRDEAGFNDLKLMQSAF